MAVLSILHARQVGNASGFPRNLGPYASGCWAHLFGTHGCALIEHAEKGQKEKAPQNSSGCGASLRSSQAKGTAMPSKNRSDDLQSKGLKISVFFQLFDQCFVGGCLFFLFKLLFQLVVNLAERFGFLFAVNHL